MKYLTVNLKQLHTQFKSSSHTLPYIKTLVPRYSNFNVNVAPTDSGRASVSSVNNVTNRGPQEANPHGLSISWYLDCIDPTSLTGNELLFFIEEYLDIFREAGIETDKCTVNENPLHVTRIIDIEIPPILMGPIVFTGTTVISLSGMAFVAWAVWNTHNLIRASLNKPR